MWGLELKEDKATWVLNHCMLQKEFAGEKIESFIAIDDVRVELDWDVHVTLHV